MRCECKTNMGVFVREETHAMWENEKIDGSEKIKEEETEEKKRRKYYYGYMLN